MRLLPAQATILASVVERLNMVHTRASVDTSRKIRRIRTMTAGDSSSAAQLERATFLGEWVSVGCRFRQSDC